MPDLPTPLDLFTQIRIHGLAFGPDGDSMPLTLNRSKSFPARAWTGGLETTGRRFKHDLSARDLPSQGYKLDARILRAAVEGRDNEVPDGALGEGRSAFVYSLEALSISGDDSNTSPPQAVAEVLISLPPPMCIKVAKPTYSRSLAREAWFYERLDGAGLTHVVTPRSYGLFQTSLSTSSYPAKLQLPDYESLVEEHFERYPDGRATLPEESGSFTCREDQRNSCTSSPWYSYRESKESPAVTVLLLERAGEVMTDADFDRDWADLDDVFDDIAAARIYQGDSRFPNVLRAPAGAKACSRHQRVHQWHYVDWEDGKIAHNRSGLSIIMRRKGMLRDWKEGGRYLDL